MQGFIVKTSKGVIGIVDKRDIHNIWFKIFSEKGGDIKTGLYKESRDNLTFCSPEEQKKFFDALEASNKVLVNKNASTVLFINDKGDYEEVLYQHFSPTFSVGDIVVLRKFPSKGYVVVKEFTSLYNFNSSCNSLGESEEDWALKAFRKATYEELKEFLIKILQ